MRTQLDEVTEEEQRLVDREQRLRAAGIRPARSRSPRNEFPPVRTASGLRAAVTAAALRLLLVPALHLRNAPPQP